MVIPAMAGPSWRSAWAEPRSVPSFAPLPLPAPPSWTQKIVSRTVPRGIPQRGRERTGTGVKFPSTSYFFLPRLPLPSLHSSRFQTNTFFPPFSSRDRNSEFSALIAIDARSKEPSSLRSVRRERERISYDRAMIDRSDGSPSLDATHRWIDARIWRQTEQTDRSKHARSMGQRHPPR